MSEEAEAVETDDTDVTPDAGPSVEEEARRLGWRPKDEFKGDPDKWVDPDTFVKRGREILPIVQANNRQLEKALQAAQAKLATVEKTLSRFAEHHSKTEQRAYERALRDLEDRQASAAEQGDVDAVRAITKEMVELQAEVTPAKPDGPPPELEEAVQEFKAANPWYEKDRAMTGAAREIAQELADAGVIDPRVQLREVAKRIREEFPHKFTNPRRSQPSAVEGDTAPARKGGKTYSDLPPEAKALCDDFVKSGLLTREKYVKEFFGQ